MIFIVPPWGSVGASVPAVLGIVLGLVAKWKSARRAEILTSIVATLLNGSAAAAAAVHALGWI